MLGGFISPVLLFLLLLFFLGCGLVGGSVLCAGGVDLPRPWWGGGVGRVGDSTKLMVCRRAGGVVLLFAISLGGKGGMGALGVVCGV